MPGTLSFEIPCGMCTECQREIAVGEEAKIIMSAGSAWKDGFTPLVECAEMFTVRVLCSLCVAKDGPVAPEEKQ